MSNIIPYSHPYLNAHLDVWHVHTIFDDIASTNTYLKEHATSLPDRTLVLANQQNAGRGRFKRHFKSERDKGIYCSFLLKHVDVQKLNHISFATALALTLTLHDLYQTNIQIKWPNDLVINNQKLAGILIETLHHAGAMDVVIGFGLNVYLQDLSDLNAIALEEVVPKTLDRNQILIRFFSIFEDLLKQDDILPLYRLHMLPAGTFITTTIEGIKTVVQIVDIQANGTLLVKKEDGTPCFLFNDEIHIPPNL